MISRDWEEEHPRKKKSGGSEKMLGYVYGVQSMLAWLESESIQEKMLKLQKLAAVRLEVWDVPRYVASIVFSGNRTRHWEPLNALG